MLTAISTAFFPSEIYGEVASVVGNSRSVTKKWIAHFLSSIARNAGLNDVADKSRERWRCRSLVYWLMREHAFISVNHVGAAVVISSYSDATIGNDINAVLRVE